MIKKRIIPIFVLGTIAVSGLFLSNTKPNNLLNNTNDTEISLSIKNDKAHASYNGISSLDELKSDSNVIVEVMGTDIVEDRDYKNVPFKVSTIKVLDVIKGDIQENEIKILQDADLDMLPKKNEKLLMFLRKGIDNKDCYIPVGGGQGIYRIIENAKSNNITLEAQSLRNENILNDLRGDYKELKKSLK